MFHYTKEQYKKLISFADFQREKALYVVSVPSRKWGIDVNNPWYDSSARFTLSDEEAIETYGEKLVREWCKKAEEFYRQFSEEQF